MFRRGKEPDAAETLRYRRERLRHLDAVLVAMDRRDELIAIVGAAEDADAARIAVRDAFGIDDDTSHTVLATQVSRFTAIERARIRDERTELLALIANEIG